MAYIIRKRSGGTDGRIWKRKRDAVRHVKLIIKRNPLKQRKMGGFIGMKVIKAKTNERERKELKNVKQFIRD